MGLVEEEEIRHKDLIKLLAKFEMYRKEDGSPFFKYRRNRVSGYKPENFEPHEIQRAAVLLVDIFHLTGGSVGGFNLYNLLTAYFLDEQKRIEINKIIGE